MFASDDLSPGEARTRQRQRRQLMYGAVALTMGTAIGFFGSFFNEGEGSLFTGNWADASLSPAAAIGISVALLIAFVAFPLWGFTKIDDYKKERNYIGFTGGMLSVIAGLPIWVVLHVGGLAPEPSALGVWLIGFVSTYIAFGYATFFR